jgi:recombination protein RecR
MAEIGQTECRTKQIHLFFMPGHSLSLLFSAKIRQFCGLFLNFAEILFSARFAVPTSPVYMNQQYPSALLEKAVGEFARLPGIGPKTAMRLVLHLLRQQRDDVESFASAIVTLKREVKYCRVCHNISDTDICQICSNPQRDATTICVVEDIQDVIAIENTHQYRGLYHVLGGIISPMDGIGPADLQIDSLVERINQGNVAEVILALNPTMEGDTTNFYIYRKLEHTNVRLSTIARGIAQNDELQYTDEITLGRSIVNRIAFNGQN